MVLEENLEELLSRSASFSQNVKDISVWTKVVDGGGE